MKNWFHKQKFDTKIAEFYSSRITFTLNKLNMFVFLLFNKNYL